MESKFNKYPKLELHIHLEGAIPYPALLELIHKYDSNSTIKNVNDLVERFKFDSFQEFIEAWNWKNKYLREYEDFTLISEAVAKNLKTQNIKYVEMFISPSLFKPKLKVQPIVEAIYNGLQKVNGITINLIVDLVRDYGQTKEMLTLEEINEVRSHRIIGIGLGGSEDKYPPEQFVDLFNQARKLGFRTTVHAGEATGPKSIWNAINLLKPDRIGHGVKSIEDKSLLAFLGKHKIPIELCPLSNLRTKVVSNPEQIPVLEFLKRGIPFSINTDDPKMFGNSLAEEYEFIEKNYDLSETEIHRIILNSIQTTWQNEEDKLDLKKEFKKVESRRIM